MGKELNCRMDYQGGSYDGRLLLETDHLLFRGDVRVRISLTDLISVSADSGVLSVRGRESAAAFELGVDAAKWADKILHPPTLLAKLGVRADTRVSLTGAFEPGFVADLKRGGATIVRAGAELHLLAAECKERLSQVAPIGERLAPKQAIWVVYPKGVEAVKEIDVIRAGRLAGLTDTKVVAFSRTHTALRFSKAKPEVR
jgi:hypothetical protein